MVYSRHVIQFIADKLDVAAIPCREQGLGKTFGDGQVFHGSQGVYHR